MRFSQRIGKTPIRDIIQLDSMDDRLKNRLFNVAEKAVQERFTVSEGAVFVSGKFLYSYCDYFGEVLAEKSSLYKDFLEELRYKIFLNDDIFFFYDFLEFIVDQHGYNWEVLSMPFNTILKEERAGYRFDNTGKLIPITDEIELAEINSSQQWSGKHEGVYEHLENAKQYFSNRENPNYKKCIAESVHAIESAAKIIMNDENATLGQLTKRLSLHPSFNESINKLYGYASDVGGVRHGNKEYKDDTKEGQDRIGEEEARFILVLAHSLTNYLISKFL